MAATPDSVDMSWEYTGRAITFPVATQNSSLVTFPPLPRPRRTFSEVVNDAAVNIAKHSVQLIAGTCYYTSVAAVQVAKTAKRRLISRNNGAHARRSSPRRYTFSPHLRPIFRQDLSGTPGRRSTAPITPPKFLKKSRPYLMPGTFPITPPRSPLLRKSSLTESTVTPQHAAGFIATDSSQTTEPPATPQFEAADTLPPTPSQFADASAAPCHTAGLTATNSSQAPAPSATPPSQTADIVASTPSHATDAITTHHAEDVNIVTSAEPWTILPDDPELNPYIELIPFEEAVKIWLKSCPPTKSAPSQPAGTSIGSLPHATETSITSPALAEDDWAADADTDSPSTWRGLTSMTLGGFQPTKPRVPSWYKETKESISNGSIESTRSPTTGNPWSTTNESNELPLSSTHLARTVGSAPDELIKFPRSLSSLTKFTGSAPSESIDALRSSSSSTQNIESAGDELIGSPRSSSSATGTIKSAGDELIVTTQPSSSSTVTTGATPDELIGSSRFSLSILKRRAPLAPANNAENVGQPPTTPRKTVNFPKHPVTQKKNYVPGESMYCQAQTPSDLSFSSVESSPFEELPWPPTSSPVPKQPRVNSQPETPVKQRCPSWYKDTLTRAPSPPPFWEDLTVENLRLAGRRTAEDQLQEESAARAKAIQEQQAAAQAKAESIARLKAAEERDRKKYGGRRMPKEPAIQSLPVEWEMKVRDALAKSAVQTVATTCSGQNITRRDIGKVLPQVNSGDDMSGWLNDQIVDGYMEHIVDYGNKVRGHKRGETPKIHAMSSFFYNNLRAKGVDSVKRWANRAKIGGKDLEKVEHVFIPVNLHGQHWTLLVVSPIYKMIEYYDSMHGASAEHVRNAKRWLASELGSSFKEAEWRLVQDCVRSGRRIGPSQLNTSDCGVFTTLTAKMISLGVQPMAVNARDIPLQRKRMVAELLNGGFSGDLAPNYTFE